VANAQELRVRGESRQLLCGVVRLQIDPADHTCNKGICVRQLEQPLSFAERLARLNGNARVDRCAGHFAAEVGR